MPCNGVFSYFYTKPSTSTKWERKKTYLHKESHIRLFLFCPKYWTKSMWIFCEARTKRSTEGYEQKGQVSIRPFFAIDIFQKQLHIWDQH